MVRLFLALVVSTAAVLAPIRAATTTGPVDATFSAPLTTQPNALLLLPDGKLLVSAPQNFTIEGQSQHGLVRLNPDGSIDPTFRVGPWFDTVTVYSFRGQPNGRVLVLGLNSSGRAFILARLNPDGSLDPTFPLSGDTRVGQFVLTDGRSINIEIPNDSNTAVLTRLTPAGAIDPSYPAVSLPLTPGGKGATNPASDPNFTTITGSFDAQGRIVVAAVSYSAVGTGTFWINQSRIFRLLADGTPDSSFAPVSISDAITQLVSARGKLYYQSRLVSGALGSNQSVKFSRLNADGSSDVSYTPRSFFQAASSYTYLTLSSIDGSVLSRTVGSGFTDISRYDSNGNLDLTLTTRLTLTGGSIDTMVDLGDGRVLVSGDFKTINGLDRPYLARLISDPVPAATRLTNVSIRATAGTGNRTLIVGFSVAGNGTKPVLVRGIGPALANYGVSNFVADPTLRVYANSSVIATNDNWDPALTQLSASLGGFALSPASKDSMVFTAVGAGSYTAQLTSNDGSSGVALVELYDASSAPPASTSDPRLVNLSARTEVGIGANILIAGFVVDGPGTKRFLIRAVGPTLANYGVTGTLAEPFLRLTSGNSEIASNFGWSATSLSAAITSSTAATVGAFALLEGSKDSAIVVNLSAGSYTAQVSGLSGSTGIALVEIYEVP